MIQSEADFTSKPISCKAIVKNSAFNVCIECADPLFNICPKIEIILSIDYKWPFEGVKGLAKV